jgi:large subunit ribosomal protein L18
MRLKKLLNEKRARRKARNRAGIFGSATKPRLAVFRSNKFVYAQLIDDEKSRTIASASIKDLSKTEQKKTKTQIAELVGETLAKKAGKFGIKQVVFDRRAYKYHGRVMALAEGVRKGGIKI